MLLGDRYRFMFGDEKGFLFVNDGHDDPVIAMRCAGKDCTLCYLIDAETGDMLGVADPRDYIVGYIRKACRDFIRVRKHFKIEHLDSEHYLVLATEFFKTVYRVYGNSVGEAEDHTFKIGLATYIKRIANGKESPVPVRR